MKLVFVHCRGKFITVFSVWFIVETYFIDHFKVNNFSVSTEYHFSFSHYLCLLCISLTWNVYQLFRRRKVDEACHWSPHLPFSAKVKNEPYFSHPVPSWHAIYTYVCQMVCLLSVLYTSTVLFLFTRILLKSTGQFYKAGMLSC